MAQSEYSNNIQTRQALLSGTNNLFAQDAEATTGSPEFHHTVAEAKARHARIQAMVRRGYRLEKPRHVRRPACIRARTKIHVTRARAPRRATRVAVRPARSASGGKKASGSKGGRGGGEPHPARIGFAAGVRS